ncbi:MAG: Clp protease ClpP, partial [Gemmatimonadaceae bacterium]|nr:Clp protease ClpP [Gemmatimonadaceae bacterium]
MTPQPAEKSWALDLRSTSADLLELSVYDHIGESLFGAGVTSKDILAQLRA